MKGLDDKNEVIKKENVFVGKEAEKRRVPDGHTEDYIDLELIEKQIADS